MTNPPNLVITGLDGYFILNFLQKSGFEVPGMSITTTLMETSENDN